MKMKRLLALGLSVTLALSLAAAPAAAATTFPDVESVNHWAKPYIYEMTQQGMFSGYEDGSFQPDRALSAVEALALCARVAIKTYNLDNDNVAAITKKWQEDLTELLPANYGWAAKECAIALEAGLLSWDDLAERVEGDALKAPLQKELFSVYLARAMGLDTLAKNLSTFSLDFADRASITEEYASYVYLLYSYGILTGDQNKNLNPNVAVSRAVSATMLSRVLAYIKAEGLAPELAAYTDYTWKVGTISKVVAGEGKDVELTLTNTISGDKKLTVPANVDIYKNDRTATAKDLKTGYYVKICYDSKGNVIAVRLTDAGKVTSVRGSVEDYTNDSVTVEVDGKSLTIAVNRFTEVALGGKAGDWSLIDEQAQYTAATVRIDEGGTAVSLQLHGGTRVLEGLIGEVTSLTGGGYSMQLIGFDGLTQGLTVPASAVVTVNGVAGSVKSSYAGRYAALRVSNEDLTQVSTMAVDSLTDYVQGSVKSLSASKVPGSITVTDFATNKAVVFPVPAEAKVYYEGVGAELQKAAVGTFVTVKLSADDEALLISAWPGSVETKGELTGITYGTKTVLEVTKEDGTPARFTLDMESLPKIKRDGKDSTITRLATGDQVTITMRYQKVTVIEAKSQSANASGTIQSVTHAIGSSILNMLLSDGTTATYTLSDSASIAQADKLVARTALQPGYKLSMIVSGEQILSVEVESTISSSSKISGQVLYVDVTNKEILFELESGAAITVNVTSSTKYTQPSGESLALKNLKTNDRLTIYGGYNGGDFDADLVIRE